MVWSSPRDWAADELVTEAFMDAHIKANFDWLYDNLPLRASMFHDSSIVTAGNAIVVTVQAAQPYCYYAAQSVAADKDSFTQSFVLYEGTYTFAALGGTVATGGKIDWYVDGVLIQAGQDWYVAGTVYAVKQTVAGVVIAATEGGRHVLTGLVNGKNGASGGYAVRLTKLWFYPAADA